MVGFLQSPTVEGAIEAEKEYLKTHPVSDPKKLSVPDVPLGLCQPELKEDVSSSFFGSFLDFDYISRWLMEGNPEPCGEPNMADFGGKPVGSGSYIGELGVCKETFELSGDRISKKVEAKEDLGRNEGSLLGLGQEKEEPGFVEPGVSEKIYVEGVLGGDVPGENLGCLIEEKLGKVSLVRNVGSDSSCMGHGATAMNGYDTKVGKTVGDKDESDNNVKSEGESSGESSSSSSSTSSDSSSLSSSSGEEDEEDEENGATSGEKKSKDEEDIDLEEGEIMLSDTEGVAWSDNEDAESGPTGPITSKNELKVLPPVPPVTVTLQPHHQTVPVGVLLSIIGAQVIVEGVEKHNPLNEGSILWVTESRSPLGIIDEIFGPVKNPYYIVRYNSENEVPTGIQQGTLVSFVQEFANHVLNDRSLYQKGYDASGENDEELSDELEFSDDEKEAEYRKMLKMKKRGTNDSKPGMKRKEKRQQQNQNGNWNRNTRNPLSGDKIRVTQDQHLVPSPIADSLIQGNFPCSSGPRQDLAGNQAMAPPFPHGPQGPGFAPCYSGPGLAMAGNQAMPPPFLHGPQGPGFAPCYSGSGQDMAGNQAMSPPFPHGPQGPGFGPPSGIWSNNGFPHQQQQQQHSIGLPNGLPGNNMLWMQQNMPFQSFQTPPQAGLAFQQQMCMMPGLPFNFNGYGGQSDVVRGPTITPWPTNLNQNTTLNQPQFGVGLPVNGSGGEQGGHSLGPQNSHSSQPNPESLNFSQGRGRGGSNGGRGHHRGGRGWFGGGRGR